MIDAALGCELDVETVDGPLTMKVPAGTQSGTDFRLSGHGAPRSRSGQRGPHIVTIRVDTPTGLTRKQKGIARAIWAVLVASDLFRFAYSGCPFGLVGHVKVNSSACCALWLLVAVRRYGVIGVK